MVILDTIDHRWAPSVSFMQRVHEEEWRCSTSSYSVLELIDRKKEEQFVRNQLQLGWMPTDIVRRRKQRALTAAELRKVYDKLTEAIQTHLPFITFHGAGQELLDSAEEIWGTTNLWAPDSLHLATAMALECDVMVTRDSELQRISSDYIPSAPPERVESSLRTLGFRV